MDEVTIGAKDAAAWIAKHYPASVETNGADRLTHAFLAGAALATPTPEQGLREALEWALSRIGEPTLVRGQNDEHYAAYHKARKALASLSSRGTAI
jgi:hypothetical protein